MLDVHTADGTRLHHLDWGDGPPIVFSHGWAVGADMWEYQLVPLSERGFRCVAITHADRLNRELEAFTKGEQS